MRSQAWRLSMRSVLGILCLALVAAAPAPAGDGDDVADASYGVFVRLVHDAGVPLADAVARLRDSVEDTGLELLADYAAGVAADDCSYGAHVLVLQSPEHSAAVLRHGPLAAFALPLRLAVWEDEGGVHVGAVNPRSLDRTIVAEDGFHAASSEALEALRSVAAGAFPEQAVLQQYGQMRDRGEIPKTMGLIAGGPFVDKIEEVAVAELNGDGLDALLDRVWSRLNQIDDDSWRWRLQPVYRTVADGGDVALIGLGGAPMEARAFQILGAGADETRGDFACPGVDHAAAFPVELLFVREGDDARILIVDAMFRMKMFFEDAGTMKFAANMRMPGSIEDELRDKVEEALY